MISITYIGHFVNEIDLTIKENIHGYEDRIHISDRMELCCGILKAFLSESNDDSRFITIANYLCSYLWSETNPYVECYGSVSDRLIYSLKNNKALPLIREGYNSIEIVESYLVLNYGAN